MSDPLGLFSNTSNNDPLDIDPLGLFAQPKSSKKDEMIKGLKEDVAKNEEYRQGVAEAGLSLGTGALGMLAGLPVAAIQKARTALAGGSTPFEKEYADAIQRMTYEPKTEAGQEVLGKAGEFINRNLIPVAPMLGLAVPKMGEGAAGMKARFAPKEVPAAEIPTPVKTGVAALKEELNAPEPAPMPAVERQPAPQLTPMQNMAQQLGGVEPFKAAEEFAPNAVSKMAEQLPDFEMQSRGRAADEVAARRQAEMELEVKRQASLDIGAAERARREQAPTGFKEWEQARDTADQQKRLERDSELAQRAGAGEQGGLFEPHMNMHRAYEEMFAKDENGVRPLSPREFKETLDNLAKEPGTAFQMPEDVSAAYKEYLNRTNEGQGDLFGAHEVLQSTSHKTWGELTSVERTKATKALKKIGPISENMVERMKALAEDKDTGITQLRAGFTKEDLGKPYEALKNNPLMAIPGVGDRLKDVGNAMIESPAQAIDLATKASDVSQNAIQKATNALTKGGTYLKGKVNNPVVHYTVDSFLKADSLAKAEITSKVHDTYLGSLRELSKTERTDAFELLNLADLNQKELTPELMQKHGVSKKVQDFVQVHQIMMNDVLGKINEAREATGKKPITARTAYSAMSMTGDFRKVVYKIVDGEQQVVGVIGADSKNIGKSSLSALEKKVLEKDPSLSFGPLQDMTKTTRSARGTPHEAFLDVLDTLGENNPHIAEFVQTLKDVAKDDPANYMGMHKHTMQKKGVFGMEGRKFWESPETNAEAFFENQVKYAESAYNWSHLAQAAKDVNEVIRHPDVVMKQDNAVRLSEEYMQNALGINPSRMGKAITDFTNAAFGAVGLGPSVAKSITGGARALANTWMLSLSPAFLGMQIIQAPTVMPAMTAFLRGRGAAPASTLLTQGLGHFAQAGMTLTKSALGKELSPVESGALAYAKKHHVYATDMVEHANQISKGAGYYATKITQTPAAVVEQATRAQVYLALVHMMDEVGITPKEGLYEQAQRFTDMAMVNYSSIEKPAIYNSLGPIGSLAYNLKSFSHNEISRWSMYAREIPKTGNAIPLLTQMATTIALAGVMGLPFFSQFEDLYDFITKKLGKPRSLVLDVQEMSKAVGKNLGEHGSFALSNGAPSLLGVDLSARLGLGDVLPSSAADAAFAGGGKLYEMGKATGRAVLSPSEENLKAAAINLAPPVAQGPLDVAWYQKNGLAYSKDPTNLRPMARRTDADILFKKIGLTGIQESAQKQANYQQAQLDKAYAEYRTQAMRTIAQDLFRNRPIEPATIDKYFKTGQGDPQTFQRDLERMAVEQNMAPQEALLLKQVASQRIPQLQSIARRTQ